MEKERKQIIAELLFLELEILSELLIAVLVKSKIILIMIRNLQFNILNEVQGLGVIANNFILDATTNGLSYW